MLFRIGCQAGTYVRKFVHDFGIKIKAGAHMAELVRTRVAGFSYNDWVTLHDLKDAYVLWKEEGREEMLRKCIRPIEDAVSHMPKIWVRDSSVDTLAHGAALAVPGIAKLHSGIMRGENVAVMALKNELVLVGKAVMGSDEMIREENGIAVESWKVFMERGIYPKFSKGAE